MLRIVMIIFDITAPVLLIISIILISIPWKLPDDEPKADLAQILYYPCVFIFSVNCLINLSFTASLLGFILNCFILSF